MSEGDPIRVLIVDDDLRIAELHRRFTERIAGFEVAAIAGTLADASEMAEVLAPDLVLLDLFFPEGNGLELLRRLRSGAAPVDVILISAAREMATLQEALRGGAFDYIIKPVLFPRFQEAFARYRDYTARVRTGGPMEQKDIDRLFHAPSATAPSEAPMPKGIDPLTLAKVRQSFHQPEVPNLSAEEVAEAVGVSRSTARRYLEFLVGEGFLVADLLYGSVGRPERRYFRRN